MNTPLVAEGKNIQHGDKMMAPLLSYEHRTCGEKEKSKFGAVARRT